LKNGYTVFFYAIMCKSLLSLEIRQQEDFAAQFEFIFIFPHFFNEFT